MISLSIIILININSAFAVELGQLYVPPASLGNRTANLSIDITPSDVEKSAKYIHLRLFDPSNNQTFQHVTFLLNITKQNQTLLRDMFHSHSGLLAIKLISNDTVGNWTVFGEREPIQWGWMPKDGKLEINSSLQKGLYHFEITIVTIDNDKNIFILHDAPKFDSWWTVDDNGNIFRNSELNQNSVLSPLKQFKSGIVANDVACKTGFVLAIKSEDSSFACVHMDVIPKLFARGWASSSHFVLNSSENFENENGIITIGNHEYYYTTVNDIMTTYRGEGVQTTLHSAIFTFLPSPYYGGSIGGCGGFTFKSDVKFSNGNLELLRVDVPEKDCLKNYTELDLTQHTIPQAGLIVSNDGKIRLLTSIENEN